MDAGTGCFGRFLYRWVAVARMLYLVQVSIATVLQLSNWGRRFCESSGEFLDEVVGILIRIHLW